MPVVVLRQVLGSMVQKTGDPFRGTEADPHGPDCSADHRVSTVAVLSWWSMFLLAGCAESSLLSV